MDGKATSSWWGDFKGINGVDALVFVWQVHLGEYGELHPTPLHHICSWGDTELCAAPHPRTATCAVRNSTLPLPKGSGRTLKCPDKHSFRRALEPPTPLIPHLCGWWQHEAAQGDTLGLQVLSNWPMFHAQEAAAILCSSMVTGGKSCLDKYPCLQGVLDWDFLSLRQVPVPCAGQALCSLAHPWAGLWLSPRSPGWQQAELLVPSQAGLTFQGW